MATNVRGPLCFVNVGLLHPGVPAQPGRGPSRATAGASVGPPRLVPPSGRSLARPLPVPSADGSAHGNERRAETLVGRGWGQSADTGGPCEGGGPWGSGRARQHGRLRGGVRAALPAASGTAAWTRRAHRRGPCAGRPHGAEGLPCVSGASRERRRPAHGQPRGEPRTRPPPARRTELAGGAPHFGVRPAVPAPARLRQLLASEAPRRGEGHHSLSWP